MVRGGGLAALNKPLADLIQAEADLAYIDLEAGFQTPDLLQPSCVV